MATALSDSRQFAFSPEYTQSIIDAKQAFSEYTADINAGKEPQEAFNRILATSNDALIEYASQYGVSDKAQQKAQQNFLRNQAQAQVSLMAQNTTLTNTSSLIQGYNNSVAATGLSQQEFASAVMATNGTLGQYLIGLNGAEASMRGYLGQVIATTAATVAMRAVTMALNAVIGMAVSWLINKAIQAWDDYIHRVDNAKAALDEFEDKNKELVSDLDKQRKTIDNLSDSYFDLAKGVDSVTGKNVSLSADDYDEFVQMNGELADAFPELISHVDEYGNRFVDLGDNAVYAKKRLEEFYKQEEENYQYEQYKNLPEMFKNEQVVMDDIQGSVNELEADLARSTATLAQMQEAVNFTSGDMINVMAEYGDDAATAYAQAFRNTYVEAMNNAIEKGDSNLYNKLNDALSDTSTGGQYSFAINLSNLSETERKYLQEYFKSFTKAYSKGLNDSIEDISQQLKIKKKEYESEWQRILPSLVGATKYIADESTQDIAASFVGALSSDIYEEIKDRPIESVIREWTDDISKMSVEERLKLEDLLDPSLSPEERVRIYEELQASLNEKGLTLPVDLVIKDDKELIDRIGVSKARLTENYKERAELNAFFDEMSINTREEYELWLDVTNGIDDATMAMRAYRDALKEAADEAVNAEAEWASERDAALDKLGLRKETNSGVEYDESWTNYLETIKQLNPELADNQLELEKCALANMQFSKAVDDLSKNFKTYKESLKDATGLTPEFSDAITALADDLTYLTGIKFSIEDASKFLSEAENLELLEKAINGSDEALRKLQERAAQGVYLHVDLSELEKLAEYEEVRIALGLDTDDFNSQMQNFVEWLNTNSNMGTIDVTAMLEDHPFLQQLANIMSSSSEVAKAVKALFAQLGWKIDWDTTPMKVPKALSKGGTITGIPTNVPKSALGKFARTYSSGAVEWGYDELQVPTNIHFVPTGGRSSSKSTKISKYTPKSLSPAQKSNAATNIDKANGGGNKDKEDDYKEFIDYFERLIETLDNSIDLLEAHLQDVVGSFAKNTLLDAQEDLIKKKMDGYASAIGMYSQKASEALSKIPSEVAAKLQGGAVAIDEFVGESNKDVVDAIGDYEKWADKVAECKQQIVELREELRQLELQKFNNVVQDFTELFDRRQSAIDTISKAISLFEAASDKIVGRGFYDVSIDQTEKQLKHLNEERDALVAQMNSAIAAGINVAGDEWFEMLEVLEDLDGQILDSQKNIEDFKNAIISLYVEGFDRWNDRYTKQIELRTKAISALQKQISIIQESGNLTGEAYIQEQITQTQKQLSMLQHEREELVKRMSDATENGVRVGTDEWYSMVDALNSVDSAIQDCEESIESLDNAILALHTETFERIQNRFSSISDEISNMADMFSDFDVATKDNKWTSEGLAQLGLLGEQYELTKRRVEQYNEEIAELNQQYSDGKYSATEYAENLANLKNAQWEQVKANKAARDSMIELNKARVDIVIEGINEETEAYSKLIEQEKEALSSEQDLHNYRKQIADATKSIVDIQKQLAAMEGDNSQSANAKRLKLEQELADAREELAEQEYEHSISSQQEALDQQLEDYQASRELEIEALQTSLENEQQILTDTFAAIKENAFLIGQEILTMAQNLNITMSPEITAPWQSGENAIASYGALLNAESSNFILRLGEVESAEWRLQEQANSSSSAIANMFANQSDNLVSQTEMANEQFRQEEYAAWNASNAIANAFGQRADGLVATIENARNSAQNLSAMSDALANSLSNSIDGAYSGASAQSALNGIADAANGVAEAARNAFNELSKLANAPKTTPKTTEHTIYGGYDGNGNYIGSRTVTVSSDGTITIPKAAKSSLNNTKFKTYASGTKGVSKKQIAWTQEQGPEMIVSPSTGAILTPLQKGDSVLPTMQTSNIWDWSKFNPTEFAKQLIENMPSNGGNVQNNTMQVGALVQVNGNVNDTMEMMQIAATTATTKIKQSFNTLSNGLNK